MASHGHDLEMRPISSPSCTCCTQRSASAADTAIMVELCAAAPHTARDLGPCSGSSPTSTARMAELGAEADPAGLFQGEMQ